MKEKYIGYMQMIVAQIGVGVSVVVSKILMKEGVSVATQVEGRFVFCSIFLLLNLLPAVLYKKYKGDASDFSLNLNKKQWSVLIAQSLCAGVLFNLIMLAGLRYTTATMAGILTSTLPAILAILSFLILKERIGNQRIFAIFLAIVGVIILHLDSIGTGHSKNALLGGVLVVLAMIPEGLYTILTKILGNVVNPLVQAVAINLISSVIFFPVWLYYVGFDGMGHLDQSHFIKLAMTGLLSYFFYYFWTAGVTKVQASMAAIFTGIMPIATTVTAIIMMGESFTLYDAAGMTFVLSSIVIGSGIISVKKNQYNKERG